MVHRKRSFLAGSRLLRIGFAAAMLPVHVFALFSTAKSLRGNPLIGSRTLNRLGLHVARTLLAHGMTWLRWRMLSSLLPSDLRRRFHRDGFLLIEDFLPDEQFRGIVRELGDIDDVAWEFGSGDTLTHHVFLHEAAVRDLPHLRALLHDERYLALLKYGSAKNAIPFLTLQGIKFHYADGGADVQTALHMDTFHPTMKAWLFLHDVAEDEGPFMYVPGSQRLTWRRLKWQYRKSTSPAGCLDPQSQLGSFRVSPDAAAALGIGAPRAFAVRANTLVVANTFGFHCRGPAARKRARFEVYASGRPNPFNPLPGLGLRVTHEMKTRALKHARTFTDRRARGAGKLAFRHAISMDRFRA